MITAPVEWVRECLFSGKQVIEVVEEVKGSVELEPIEEKVKEEVVEKIGVLGQEEVKNGEVVGEKRHELVGGDEVVAKRMRLDDDDEFKEIDPSSSDAFSKERTISRLKDKVTS